jgi:hypothetical protein
VFPLDAARREALVERDAAAAPPTEEELAQRKLEQYWRDRGWMHDP